MGKLNDLKRLTNNNIMAVQAKAVALEQRSVDLQTFHDTHWQNITNIHKINRELAILIVLINNKTIARQALLDRLNLVEAEDIGNRVTEMKNQIGIMQRMEKRYHL